MNRGRMNSLRDPLTEQIIGAAIEVHRSLGPGLLETAYEECLCWELGERRIDYRRQTPVPIKYKGHALDIGYRLDIVVADLVLVELKTVERLIPIHEAQLLTYLRLTDIRVGLLLNFNTPMLRNGIKRMVL
jgi:GxxExxY protein